jgi:hypothetical protein
MQNSLANKSSRKAEFRTWGILVKLLRHYDTGAVDHLRIDNLRNADFAISGAYDSEEKMIYITLLHGNKRGMYMSKTNVSLLIKEFLLTYIHEYTHYQQSVRMGSVAFENMARALNVHDEFLYYTSPNEMEAYANEAALEICIEGKLSLQYVADNGIIEQLFERPMARTSSMYPYKTIFERMPDYGLLHQYNRLVKKACRNHEFRALEKKINEQRLQVS